LYTTTNGYAVSLGFLESMPRGFHCLLFVYSGGTSTTFLASRKQRITLGQKKPWLLLLTTIHLEFLSLLLLIVPPLFHVPSKYWNHSSYTPATDRLLNYDSYDAIAAVQLLKDRTNPVRLPEAVPVGMSQLSHLPDDNDQDMYPNDDWLNSIEELSDDEDYRDSRRVLSRHYNELSEAFNNSKMKETLEEEFKVIMNQYIVKARGSAAIPSTSQGTRVSMLPASSNRRKTHGTKHY